MIELKVDNTALAAVRNTELKANFGEVEEELRQLVQPYAAMVVTEADVGAAKSDRARIRKAAEGIDGFRKSVKEAYMGPMKDFEADCNRLKKLCIDAANSIDVQVKRIEQERKDCKLLEIRRVYGDMCKHHTYFGSTSLERIFTQRWLNATYPMEQIGQEIARELDKTDADVKVILLMDDQYRGPCLVRYGETHDIADVVRYRDALERASADEAPKPAGITPSDGSEAVRCANTEYSTYTVSIDVTGTREQLAGLSEYMKEHGITYAKRG